MTITLYTSTYVLVRMEAVEDHEPAIMKHMLFDNAFQQAYRENIDGPMDGYYNTLYFSARLDLVNEETREIELKDDTYLKRLSPLFVKKSLSDGTGAQMVELLGFTERGY